jgi:hypothetical protein
MDMSKDMEQWQVPVDTAMKPQAPQKAENNLLSHQLLHGVSYIKI